MTNLPVQPSGDGGSPADALRTLEQRRRERREHERRLRRQRLVLVLVGLIVLMVSAFITARWGQLWFAGVFGDRSAPATMPGGRLTVAVVGTDEKVHDPGRTDAILVASFDLRSGQVGILQLPRDTRVRVADSRAYERINAVWATGGPTVLRRTLEALLGVPIDGYVKLNFAAFVRLVDAIGGVEVNVERPMRYVDRAQDLHIDLKPGRQRLNGEKALQYVRFRHDGLGDVAYDPGLGVFAGRVQRQQEFLRALEAALLQPSTLWRLPRVVTEVYRLVETDVPLDLIVAAARWAMQHPQVDLQTAVLPGSAELRGGASYWVVDPAAVRETARTVLLGSARTQVVPVAVLNAVGTPGLAAEVARRLSGSGFQVVYVGNAPFDGQPTRIWSAPEHRGDAERVAAALQLGREVLTVSGQRPAAAGTAATVVVLAGRDLAAVMPRQNARAGR